MAKKIVRMEDVWVGYHVETSIELDDGSGYTTHFRWATQEEESAGKELVDEDDYTMKEYYESNILGHTITNVKVDARDRDDEAYFYCETENGGEIEIPLGFCPESCEISGLAWGILPDEDIEAFYKKEAAR